MEWLNEPASWQRIDDVLKVNVDPGTDFWRVTGYGYIRDSGHVYGDVLAGDLDVAVRVRGTWATQYDQAGVMLRADERLLDAASAAIAAVRGAKSAARLSMRAPVRKLVVSAGEADLALIRPVLGDVQAAGKVEQVVACPSAAAEPVHHVTL